MCGIDTSTGHESTSHSTCDDVFVVHLGRKFSYCQGKVQSASNLYMFFKECVAFLEVEVTYWNLKPLLKKMCGVIYEPV